MTTIETTKATERLSRKLQRAGIPQWIGIGNSDTWGKYLRFQIGGRCVGGCGWTLTEAEQIVDDLIANR